MNNFFHFSAFNNFFVNGQEFQNAKDLWDSVNRVDGSIGTNVRCQLGLDFSISNKAGERSGRVHDQAVGNEGSPVLFVGHNVHELGQAAGEVGDDVRDEIVFQKLSLQLVISVD